MRWFVLLFVVFAVVHLCDAQCACNNTVTWSALKALYDSTNGPQWLNRDRWLEPGSSVCEWYGFSNCNNLTLSNNNLRGTLPPALGLLGGTLKTFGAQNNTISGTLPPEYSAWTSILDFRVRSNRITGTFPTEYSSWSSVVIFLVSGNNIGGTLPPQYSAWSSLASFDTDKNNISGSLPPEYSTWRWLTNFDVSVNHLTGTFPSQYSSWTMLVKFFAGINGITGSLPPQYSSWTQLYTFDVSSNQLAGILPQEYSSWANIVLFSVYDNQLSGSLPPEYSAWGVLLRQFFVNQNAFAGTLPPEYGAFTSLDMFVASSNRFTSTLPPQYSTWPNFATALLDNNNFTGSLPASWSGKLLMALSLHNNRHLGGSIPARLSVPVYASVCNTSICGSLPSAWASTTWTCQDFTSSDFPALRGGDTSFLRPLPPPVLPPCPTPAPPSTQPPSTTTAAPGAPATLDVPAALAASSGLATTAFGANAIGSVALASFGGGGGPGAAALGSFVQVSGLSARVSARLRDCGGPSSSPTVAGAAVDDEVGSFVGDNPTTLALPGRLSSSGGTVVGNALLLFAAPPLAAAVYHVVRWAVGTIRRNNDEDTVGTLAKLLRLAVRQHLVVYAWVLAPTAAAAAVLLADGVHGSGGGGGPVALGVFGLVVVAAPTAVIAVAYARSRPLKGEVFPAALRRRRSSTSLSELARVLCADRGSWALPHQRGATRGRQKTAPGAVSQLLQHGLSETLHGCVFPHGHVFMVDSALAGAQGLLSGLALSPLAAPSCAAVRGLLWSIFSVSVCAAVFEAWLWPRATLLDEGITLVMTVWTALVALLSALGLEDAASGAAAAQAALSLCCVALQLASGYVRRLPAVGAAAAAAQPEQRCGGAHAPKPQQPSGAALLSSPRCSDRRTRLLERCYERQGVDALRLLIAEICAVQSLPSPRVARVAPPPAVPRRSLRLWPVN